MLDTPRQTRDIHPHPRHHQPIPIQNRLQHLHVDPTLRHHAQRVVPQNHHRHERRAEPHPHKSEQRPPVPPREPPHDHRITREERNQRSALCVTIRRARPQSFAGPSPRVEPFRTFPPETAPAIVHRPCLKNVRSDS